MQLFPDGFFDNPALLVITLMLTGLFFLGLIWLEWRLDFKKRGLTFLEYLGVDKRDAPPGS